MSFSVCLQLSVELCFLLLYVIFVAAAASAFDFFMVFLLPHKHTYLCIFGDGKKNIFDKF